MTRWRDEIPPSVLADLAAYCDWLRTVRYPDWDRVERDLLRCAQ